MIKLAALKHLVHHLAQSEVRSLALEEPGLQVRIVMGSCLPPVAAAVLPGPSAAPDAASPGAPNARLTVERELRSPLIGFFVAAHPERATLLADAGQRVAPQQVLGLIRTAGGILRTVRSPWAGTITQRRIEDGVRVDCATPLFCIRLDTEEPG